MKRVFSALVTLTFVRMLSARVVGYGSRTYVQALARLCRKLRLYITKHQSKLEAVLPGDTYVCVTGMLDCLLAVEKLLNEYAS